MSEVDDIRFFYMPGCSSCQRTKEFLVAYDVDFEPVNVVERPEERKFLSSIGIDMVPAVSRGGAGTEAVLLDRVARFLELDYASPVKLSPDELYQRYFDINRIAQGFVKDMPAEHLEFHFPERPRPFIALAHHAFHIGAAFLHCYRNGELPFHLMETPIPGELRDGEAMAGYGAAVLADMERWWEEHGQYDPFLREVDTYFGRATLHEVYERCVWHTAQHVRQLEMFLAHFDVPVSRPLRADDLAGLPLPEGVWLSAM
ncbi:MAG: glutaredoxin domain-containing protein [Gammaproteobacteria bacterium]|nr:glutaredoxin domain-containing protein [Gammaproteobacteria bacterium]